MFSLIQQATLMSDRYPNRHRSNPAGKVDGMLLLTAGAFPRLNERGSIEALSVYRILTRRRPFPRLNERGSIEARSAGALASRATHVSTFE